MCLNDALTGKMLKILGIDSGQQIIRKLNSIGLHINDILIKHEDSDWGPILISLLSQDSSKLALGRDLAEKISVEYVN